MEKVFVPYEGFLGTAAVKEQLRESVAEPVQTAPDDLAAETSFLDALLGTSMLEPPIERHAEIMSDPRFFHPANAPTSSRIVNRLHQTYGNGHVQRVVDLVQAAQDEGLSGEEVSDDIEQTIARRRGAGKQLERGTRSHMESLLGHDFGDVSIHTDSAADSLARALQAKAFTVGSDVFFQEGAYQPTSESGRKLLGHELTHVVQQRPQLEAGNSPARHAPMHLVQRRPDKSPKEVAKDMISAVAADAGSKSPTEVAKDMISAFAADAYSPQAFPKLDKADIVSGLQARVANPLVINQAGLNVCGPAAAAYTFASSDIVGYTKMAISLYTRGKATCRSYTIKAGSDLRSHGPDDYKWGTGLKPEPIDWMVLSSMRDAENWAFDFKGAPSDAFSAITMPGEMEEWLEDIAGFKEVVDETNLVFTKGLGHLGKVNSEYSNGKFVVLFINANMIYGKTKKAAKKHAKGGGKKAKEGKMSAGLPNHWVVLESNVVIVNDSVIMWIWTWGGERKIDTTKDAFEDNYYGAIFAK